MRLVPAKLSTGLIAAVVVYLSLRGAMLAQRFEELCHPGYELTLVGNVAHAAASPWGGLPLSDYFDNCGGHLVCGLLGGPFFALLGESYLTLKLVPLSIGLGALLCLWAILAPRAGRGAAALACLAFALGPPLLARLSVTAMGNHFESLLALFACYWSWLRWCESGGDRRRAWAFGLVAGFSVFFYLGSLLWLALLGLAHLRARGSRAALRDAWHAAPAFSLGAAPLLWIALAVPGRVENFVAYNLGPQARASPDEVLERAWDVLARVLPTSGLYPDVGPLPGRAAEVCLLLALALSWVAVARTAASGPRGAFALPLALYPPALLLAFAISRFDFEPLTTLEAATTRRYLAPFHGLALVTLGLAFGSAWEARRRALPATLVALVLTTAPSALSLALPPATASPSGRDYRGWSGHYLARVLLRDVARREDDGRPVWDLARIAAKLERVPQAERGDVAFGLGYYLGWTQPGDPLEPVLELAAGLREPLAQDALEGVGAYLRELLGSDAWDAADLRAYLARIEGEHAAAARAVVRGTPRELGSPLDRSGPTAFERACALGDGLPVGLRPVWRGALAEELERLEREGPPREREAARRACARTCDEPGKSPLPGPSVCGGDVQR